jgi:hypothetical protein
MQVLDGGCRAAGQSYRCRPGWRLPRCAPPVLPRNQVCREWEAAAKQADVDRVVIFRFGIVLAKEGGALGRMLPVFQIFAGGPLGSGRQWCSWIHRWLGVQLLCESQLPGFWGASGQYSLCCHAHSPHSCCVATPPALGTLGGHGLLVE